MSFDLWAVGSEYKVAWTAAAVSDAFLVLDRNTNGVIDDGSELFGNVTEQPAPSRPAKRNGFAALAVFDSNLDEQITSSDSIYSSLRLWIDANHNGASEPVELATLASRGIVGIGLAYRESQRRDRHGNLFRYRAQVNTVSKKPVWAYDVFLVGDTKSAPH